jgi:putative membrane protein
MEIKPNDNFYKPFIVIVSIAIPLVVTILMLMPKIDAGFTNAALFPLFHAILNGTTFFVLLAGYYFIKKKNVEYHRATMIVSLLLSTIFLISYVISHATTPSAKFGGQGVLRPIYFLILVSHILLATSIVPLALFAIYRGLTGEIEKHKKIVKYTLPIWLYVSATGVVVYLFMKQYY